MDIFIFNNYSFVPLIAMRFLRKKYNKIFSNVVHYFHVLGIFYEDIFEAKFYVLPSFLVLYPIKY